MERDINLFKSNQYSRKAFSEQNSLLAASSMSPPPARPSFPIPQLITVSFTCLCLNPLGSLVLLTFFHSHCAALAPIRGKSPRSWELPGKTTKPLSWGYTSKLVLLHLSHGTSNHCTILLFSIDSRCFAHMGCFTPFFRSQNPLLLPLP